MDSHALHVSILNSTAGKFDDIMELNKPDERSKVRQSHLQLLSSQQELGSPNWAYRSPYTASAQIEIIITVYPVFSHLGFEFSVRGLSFR